MYFDLALLAGVLALLHVTLYFFTGHRKLELITNLFAFAGLGFTAAQYAGLYGSTQQPFASLTGVLLLLSMSLFIGYLAMYLKYKRPSIGLFVFPLIIIFLMISRFAFGVPVAHDSIVVTFWLYIHLPFTILGTAFFMLSTFTGVMYFIQERQLKSKNFGGIVFRRFPPLDTINSLNNTTLYIGFYAFTIGLLAGIVWMFYSSGRVNFLSPKLVFALVTWIIYSSITFYKQFRGMSPKDTALSTIIGFISVLITYIGVAFFVMG